MLIVWVYYIIFAITLIYSLYFSISGVIGILLKNKCKFEETDKRNNFAILIAARNESKVIGNLLDSLKNQNYPKDKFEIYVIPNNCTDNTKEVAANNSKILECNVEVKTKGDVLKFAFNELKDNKEIDAYIVFDADNIVHPDFLMHMNSCLESGYNVAQGFRDAKNPSDNWLSGSYSLFYLFQNVFFNRARMGLNASASINGTGFMIRKSLIDKNGFETFTLTEDVEFTGQCALNNEKIAFVENAITYDEYPNKFMASWKQRKRWSAGIISCMKLYNSKLISNFFKTGKLASLDVALVYLGPIMQIIGFINMVMLIIFKLCGIYLHDIFSYLFAYGWFYFIISYIIAIIVELFVIYYKKKKPSSVLSGIFLFSIFTVTWIPINIICILKKQTKWEEIKHTRNVKINEIIE